MASIKAKFQAKNVINIPKSIVNLLGIEKGDYLYFTPQSDGSFKVTTYEPTLNKVMLANNNNFDLQNIKDKQQQEHLQDNLDVSPNFKIRYSNN